MHKKNLFLAPWITLFLVSITTSLHPLKSEPYISAKHKALVKDFGVGYAAGLVPGIGQCEALLHAASYAIHKNDDNLLALWMGHALGFSTYIFLICDLAKNHGPYHAASAGIAIPIPAFLFLKNFGMLARTKEWQDNNKLMNSWHKIKDYFNK